MSDLVNQIKSLGGLSFFLRNINEGFRIKIQNKVNADGVFLDIESELNAVANWDQWKNHRILPDIISTDEETLRTTTSQFEAILTEIHQGVLNLDGEKQYLNFADIKQLMEYFKKNHPDHAEFIEQSFEKFSHDLNSSISEIDNSFSANKEMRTQFNNARNSTSLTAISKLLEYIAQTLEKSSSPTSTSSMK